LFRVFESGGKIIPAAGCGAAIFKAVAAGLQSISPPLKFHTMDIKKDGDSCWLTLSDEDFADPLQLKENLEKKIIVDKETRIIISLKNTTQIDSMGIGALVSAHVVGRTSGCEVQLAFLQPNVATFIRKTHLDSVLTIINDLGLGGSKPVDPA
jgi:anti-anti-sigma factor